MTTDMFFSWGQLAALLPSPQMIWNLKYTKIVTIVYSAILLLFAIFNCSDNKHNYKITQILKHLSLMPFYIVAIASEIIKIIHIYFKKIKRFLKRELIRLIGNLWKRIRYYLSWIQTGLIKFADGLISVCLTVWQNLEWICKEIFDVFKWMGGKFFNFVVMIGNNLEWAGQQIWTRLKWIGRIVRPKLIWIWLGFKWIVDRLVDMLNFVHEIVDLTIRKITEAYNYVFFQIVTFFNYLYNSVVAFFEHVFNSIVTFLDYLFTIICKGIIHAIAFLKHICRAIWSFIRWLTKPIRVVVIHFMMLYSYIKLIGRQIWRNLSRLANLLLDRLIVIWQLIMDCLWACGDILTLIFDKFVSPIWRVCSWLANKFSGLFEHVYCCLKYVVIFLGGNLDWIWSFIRRWFLYCRRIVKSRLWSVALFFWKWLIRPCWILIKAAYFVIRGYYQALRQLIRRCWEAFKNIYRSLTAPIRHAYNNVKTWISERRRASSKMILAIIRQTYVNVKKWITECRRESSRMISAILKGLKAAIRQTYVNVKKGMSEIRANLKIIVRQTYTSTKETILDRLRQFRVSGNKKDCHF